MTTIPLDGLFAALHASPENLALRAVVLQACLERQESAALVRLLELCGDLDMDAAQRRAARSLLAACDRIDLRQRLEAPDPSEDLLEEARRLADGGHLSEASDAYRRALALNPTLDDPVLSARLTGKIVPFGAARGREPVPSLANDDTDALDASRLLQPAAARVAFDDVGGLEAVKQEIRRRIITPFLKPSLFQRFKRQAGGGILMYGPPGCGKTLLARATAGECGARFYNVDVTDVLDMYIGESERKLHAIFEQARRTAPAVLFFDEIEALGGKRQHAREATSAKLVSQFLTELDGFAQKNEGVLILGATNVPWAVDPAFRRSGRFDRVLFVPPPDLAARRTILERLLAERPGSEDIDAKEVAKRTSSFSGADLRNIVDSAADEAIEQSIERGLEVPISMAHIGAALQQVRPTTLEWLTTARNHARYANQGGQYDAVLDFLKDHG